MHSVGFAPRFLIEGTGLIFGLGKPKYFRQVSFAFFLFSLPSSTSHDHIFLSVFIVFFFEKFRERFA